MSINQVIWKIGDNVDQVKETKLVNEEELEVIIQKTPSVLNDGWLIIGRQVQTEYNQYIDLLAIDASGAIIIIELKKDKTPRDVIAQCLDYASWVKTLGATEISEIFNQYNLKYLSGIKSLDTAFYEHYGIKLEEDAVNSSHQIVVVASALDSSTERIVNYLSDSNISINVVFFKVFEDNNQRYLSRAWFIDPVESSVINAVSKCNGPWNGEYYVSFGQGERSWEDAVEYGFISAGGGIWYSRTLNMLNVGDRVWVNIPQQGYVGVGKVTDTAKKATETLFSINGEEKTIYQLSNKANYHSQYNDDDDKAEYIVKIQWDKTVRQREAVYEVGLFGNQNSVCKPTTEKWNHTVERLKALWSII